MAGASGSVVSWRRTALFPGARSCTLQRPAPSGSTAMLFIAIAFLASTAGMLVATAWEVVRRTFRRHFGHGA